MNPGPLIRRNDCVAVYAEDRECPGLAVVLDLKIILCQTLHGFTLRVPHCHIDLHDPGINPQFERAVILHRSLRVVEGRVQQKQSSPYQPMYAH